MSEFASIFRARRKCNLEADSSNSGDIGILDVKSGLKLGVFTCPAVG